MLLLEFYNAFPNSTEMFSAKNVKLLASKIYSFLTSLRAITGNVGLGQTITRQQKIKMLIRYASKIMQYSLPFTIIIQRTESIEEISCLLNKLNNIIVGI